MQLSAEARHNAISSVHLIPLLLLFSMTMDVANQLWAQPWVPFWIGDREFLIKAKIYERQLKYSLMITDGQSVWCETLGRSEIASRVQVCHVTS
jgi:hypothetical protein